MRFIIRHLIKCSPTDFIDIHSKHIMHYAQGGFTKSRGAVIRFSYWKLSLKLGKKKARPHTARFWILKGLSLIDRKVSLELMIKRRVYRKLIAIDAAMISDEERHVTKFSLETKLHIYRA
ncbi:unnamed protein product [Blepharisma stoltei]|uniref:Uncharacterized protein n=1 Tax=Blepharisma stoltei TaxID=1481888 RepID=A0AAU9ICM6_9CILI|nr:unnamed protein product [Blepharisma stoltei]